MSEQSEPQQLNRRSRVCTVEGCSGRTVGRRLCRKHYQAAWKAGELAAHQLEPTRPRLRDRKVCPPDHKHAGSTTCYIQHQCRCDPCMDLHTVTHQRRYRLKAYGRFDTGLVDVVPVREHMLMLGEFGLGYKRVAELAGIGITAARTVLWGRQDPGRVGEMQKRIKRETAAAILRVRPMIEHLADGQIVPARGVQRRLQALVARGWSMSKLARRLDMEVSNFSSLIRRDHAKVSTYRAVHDLYEELWDQNPPEDTHRDKIAASGARNYARKHGWVPPLAWDDIDTDPHPPQVDEDVVVEWRDLVDHAAVELAIAGERVRLSPASRREAIARLHVRRWSHGRIAEQLHCAAGTVQRISAELGLTAWTKEEIDAGTELGRQGRRATR